MSCDECTNREAESNELVHADHPIERQTATDEAAVHGQ
jgi:hypothetical protein